MPENRLRVLASPALILLKVARKTMYTSKSEIRSSKSETISNPKIPTEPRITRMNTDSRGSLLFPSSMRPYPCDPCDPWSSEGDAGSRARYVQNKLGGCGGQAKWVQPQRRTIHVTSGRQLKRKGCWPARPRLTYIKVGGSKNVPMS